MTIFTYCPVGKSFFIALAVMVSGLFILKISSANNSTACAEKQGQSIVTLKNIYRSVSVKSFVGIKTLEWKTDMKKITYHTVNYFSGDKSTLAKEHAETH